PHTFKPAADGQMGCLLKLYREWQLSGDTEWLRSLWPQAKRALEFAWHHWDPDRDGVMTGEQHNTYDIEFWGPNPMMGALYLGALRAGAEIALALGDDESAATYQEVFEEGSAKLDAACWEHVQRIPPPDEITTDGIGGMGDAAAGAEGVEGPKYQFGLGCLSDQLLGQWFCHVVGLGYVLPEDRVKQALQSVYRYNSRRDLSDHPNCQRIYALNDESGLLLCSWPRGGRPALPFPYSDEVWTGIEYQVAAHLIYEGFVEEGLDLVAAVRERHAGHNRNPWNEFECGHHYARAMSSWSLLLALSGYQYSAIEQSLAFAPRLSAEDFRCFFTTGSGWGLFSQRQTDGRMLAEIRLDYGELALRSVRLRAPGGPVQAELEGMTMAAEREVAGEQVVVSFPRAVTISAGQTLRLCLE
ncbi:MAG: GH116 family glycosyl hydrolase, partial [Armatimonadota bacterium]